MSTKIDLETNEWVVVRDTTVKELRKSFEDPTGFVENLEEEIDSLLGDLLSEDDDGQDECFVVLRIRKE